MAKYITGKSSFFFGGSNIKFKLILCENKSTIPLTLQSHVLN